MKKLVFAVLGIVALVGVVVVSDRSTAVAEEFHSVEVGVAEVSPSGAGGGFAIPASGTSGNDTSCDVTVSPNPVFVSEISSESTNTGGGQWGTKGVAVFTTWYSSSGTGTLSLNGTSLGTYTNRYNNNRWPIPYGALNVPGQNVFNLVVNYTWGQADEQQTTIVRCDDTLTILADNPDLDPSRPVLPSAYHVNSGDYNTLAVGSPAAFRVELKNIGTLDANKTFANGFWYRYNNENPVDTWHRFDTVVQSGLAKDATATHESIEQTFNKTGSVTIRYCADTALDIEEANESNNCAETTYTVTTGPTNPPSVSCDAFPDPAKINEQVTYTASINNLSTPFDKVEWAGSSDDGKRFRVEHYDVSASPDTVSRSFVDSGDKWMRLWVTKDATRYGPFDCPSLKVNGGPTGQGPQVNLKAQGENDNQPSDNPKPVSPNSDVLLDWTSQRADSCTTIGFTGSGTSGTAMSTVGVSSPVTYRVECTNAYGNASDAVQVDIMGAPEIEVNPERVNRGGTTNVSWSVNGNKGCSLTAQNSDSHVPTTPLASDGSDDAVVESDPIVGETDYAISCNNGQSDTATVRIKPTVIEE